MLTIPRLATVRVRHWAGAVIVGFLLLAGPVGAQWRNLPMDGVPMGPDGKPNMAAPAPRTSDGKPDLSGIYQPNMRYFRDLAADIGIQNVPMTADARKIHTELVVPSNASLDRAIECDCRADDHTRICRQAGQL